MLVTGNYQTLFGNPYEFLEATIDKHYKAYQPLLLRDGEIYTIRFKDGEELVGSRNPHITMGNMLLARKKYCTEIDKYFELTDNIVCVNAINSNLQQRLNGCDYDSDAMLITNDSRRKRKIIETVLAAYDELKHLKIKEDEADSDEDTLIAVKRAEIFKNCLDTVKRNVTNDHVLHLLLKELDLGKESEYSVSRAKSLLFACLLFEENGRLLSKIKTPGEYSCADLSLIYDANEINADDCLEYIYGYSQKFFGFCCPFCTFSVATT